MLSLILSLFLGAGAADSAPERFIVLSEFQVWADAVGPEVFKELNKLYLKTGRSHIFQLYPRYDYYVWELARMQHWVDEAVTLGAFNVFCMGDDIRTARGHLFTPEGLNPHYRDFLFQTVSYAHQRGLMVAIEPLALPEVKDQQHLTPWLRSWLGPEIPRDARADIVKLSIEWFVRSGDSTRLRQEVEAFFTACRQVNPEVFIYVDSIGGKWRQPQPFHHWLLRRFPGTIISHYLNTQQVEAFRAIGARNMMVQINPSEIMGRGGQFFIYYPETVSFLKDVVNKRVRYLSLAGVNFGYNRYDYDLFLEVVRPHLDLAPNLEALRKTLLPDKTVNPATQPADSDHSSRNPGSQAPPE